MDDRIVLKTSYTFSLCNNGENLLIIKVVDKKKVLNPFAGEFNNLPTEWYKETPKYFILKEELNCIPEDLDLVLYLRDVKHRYFKLMVKKEQGVIKTDSRRTLKCLI